MTPSARNTLVAGIPFRIILVFAMALPMLVLYALSTLGPLLGRDLRFEPASLGYLVMSSFGLAAILSPWAGAIVDRIGSRHALIGLFSVISLAFALIATAKTFQGLIIATALCGIAQALANPVTNLLIAQQVPPEQRARVVGLKQSGVQFAALFAGLALPGIAFHYGWETAFGVIVPVALLFGIATPFFTPGKHSGTGKGFMVSLPNSLLLRLMSIQFCVGLSLSAFVTFLPTFATRQGMPLSLAGALIAVFGVMGMLSRIVLTPLGGKLEDESLLLLALIAVAACAVAVTMQAGPESHWQLWAGSAGMGLTAVATNAIAMSMLIRDPAFGPVTIASGFVSVAFFGGFALGPPLYGALSSHAEGLLGWGALISVLLCACILSLALASARRRNMRMSIIGGPARRTKAADI